MPFVRWFQHCWNQLSELSLHHPAHLGPPSLTVSVVRHVENKTRRLLTRTGSEHFDQHKSLLYKVRLERTVLLPCL